MTSHIRTATISDAEAVCHVLRRSIAECCIEDHNNDPSALEAWLRNKTTVNVLGWLQASDTFPVVAEMQGIIVGFAMYSRSGELMFCYVIPEALFKGIGKAMLDAIESHALAAGVQTLHLESTSTARSFYLRNGYISTGSAKTVFGLAGHPMEKNLAL